MGRPKGDGNRSKTRPSSSSLAASLLPSGSANVGFGGFIGSSRLEFPQSTEEITPPDVDGEVAQHLKRLGRKDPITKLKALTSLCTLFKQKEGQEIVQIVPQWAFEYKKLLYDNNREVRRATHEAMTSLVATIGRGLAPHLKSLMGPWWFSQFDPVPEISQAARKSLQAAFPAQEKRLEALFLCTSDVFLYLDENLKLTPQAMSDKAVPKDELVEMHQRVISSSLLALATLIDIILGMKFQRSDTESATSERKNSAKAKAAVAAAAIVETMFTTHKRFLEILKSPSPGVRSATYTVLGSFIKHVPHVFGEGDMKVISSTILGSFQEKDPTCHSSMWDAILLLCKRFPECWSLCAVNKNVLPRFWSFLRHGCYGSQQISYPILITFLDCIPTKVLAGDKFLLDLFQNLWTGRSTCYSSADRMAFFKAFRECFLWGITHASRYVKREDDVTKFQLLLIERVLFMLLWREYFSGGNQVERDGLVGSINGLIGNNRDQNPESPLDMRNIKQSQSYIQDLGNYVAQILSDIFRKGHIMLDAFCVSFQRDCLEAIKQLGCPEKSTKHVEQIISFMWLLEKQAVQKGENWPLVYLVGPLLSESFPLIKSVDLPAAVKLLSVAVAIFGARSVVPWFLSYGREVSHKLFVDGEDSKLKPEVFLQIFEDDFVLWCLHGGDSSSLSARLDFLLSLLEDTLFYDQWRRILVHATNLEDLSQTDSNSLDVDRVGVLALLMEKVRRRTGNKEFGCESSDSKGYLPEHFQHELLDSAAVCVSRHPLGIYPSCARFLGAVLGGSAEDDHISLLSRNSLIIVFEELQKKLISLLMISSFTWSKYASSLLMYRETKDSLENPRLPIRVLDMAKFALEVLESSFFCLKNFDESCELVPCLLATTFFIKWESSMMTLHNLNISLESYRDKVDIEDLVSTLAVVVPDNIRAMIDLGESTHAIHSKIGVRFWRSLSLYSIQQLRNILIATIRFALFSEDVYETDKVFIVYSEWVVEILGLLSRDHDEEQAMLGHLLSQSDCWPLWVEPLDGEPAAVRLKIEHLCTDMQISRHHQFVAFVDKLVSRLGASKLIGGSFLENQSSSLSDAPVELVPSPSACYLRIWLAVEILCTWKWQGDSASGSLLPFFTECARRGKSSSEGKLLDSILIALLDGALLHGASIPLCSFNVWPASDEDVDKIQDPFLRVLVSLLLTLFIKNSIWGKADAYVFLEYLLNKLFIGSALNKCCLRILPYILNVLMIPLHMKHTMSDGTNRELPSDSPNEGWLQCSVSDWLQKSLTASPITLWPTGQPELEEWVQVALSCYPLGPTGGTSALNLDSSRDVSHEEKKLLLNLFRKQRSDKALGGRDTAVKVSLDICYSMENPLSLAVQMTLAKLLTVSVGYCSDEFDEDDWIFVLSQLRRWIEAIVVALEEMAETVDYALQSTPASDNSAGFLEKLEIAAQDLDSSSINIAKIALFIFSRICGLTKTEGDKFAKSLESLRTAMWENIRDRVFEDVLRMFFATGVAESIASSYAEQAASIVASTRHAHLSFWELVSATVVNSPHHANKVAVRSAELWGLSKGPISSLYAILFSSKPISSLQFAAYHILSTAPIQQLAITKEANYFVSWSLLLTYLESLPSLSPARERLIQYLQDSGSPSTILDYLFLHIPLKLGSSNNLKKRESDTSIETTRATSAAKEAIRTSSSFFVVKSLWPVGPEEVSSLAGAIYGLMLRLLPAFVRSWFTSLRDRSLSSAIEIFTKTWCSPDLLSDELSQIKGVVVADENLSISVNKSNYEVTAIYKKEEAGMDLVIRLPSCYPLRPVDVDCTRILGISETRQRKWMLSMAAFVRNQNGALAEAIHIWKSNVDKEFQGVEECPICYSIIHTTNHGLPRLACKTCKHKFHSACLYKWFSTSHKSTCPLCQTPF
ncbi:E3 ubiquitin-protein ligase listerin isoform X2 [Amborella trichopoda]|uniref:E3 ubiquitin-protein ligase listerin isoform X2 n=1 Tax=Amborella trichopoda TaxID=13333 RepID=UPI0009BCC21F|nr:E3 ubiquitin-protein ligase listerin isoform X2 [Amborella trichopoda]|eukprot:XP_020522309.1 E3 ubiquitin-protein ligase listerin isoform X2 [Amborella trichopoda]